MHLLDEHGNELTAADIDEWYDTLSDEDVYGLLEFADPAEVIQQLFTQEEMLALLNDVPPEWQEQIIRAYTVFGVEEFAWLKSASQKIGKLRPGSAAWKDFLSGKAQKQLRDPHSGEWRKMVARIALKKKYENVAPISKREELEYTPEGVATGTPARINKPSAFNVPKKPGEPDVENGRVDGEGTFDDPIDVQGDVDRAAELIAEGKHIRLNDGQKLRVLVGKIMENHQNLSEQAKLKMKYNLCLAQVGPSLFCQDNVDRPRIDMPQTEGEAFAESLAERFHSKEGGLGGADITPDTTQMLSDLAANPQSRRVKASELTASQRELDALDLAKNVEIHNYRFKETLDRVNKAVEDAEPGSKEKQKLTELRDQLVDDPKLMWNLSQFQEWGLKDKADKKRAERLAETGDGSDNQEKLLKTALEEAVAEDKDMASIINDEFEVKIAKPTQIDKNGYIIDGHHRWATSVIMNGDGEMEVKVVPMDIGEVLDLYTAHTTMMGIKPAAASDAEREMVAGLAKDKKKLAQMQKKAESDLRRIIASRTDWSKQQVDDYLNYLKSDPKTREVPPWLAELRVKNANAQDKASLNVDQKKKDAVQRRTEAKARAAERAAGSAPTPEPTPEPAAAANPPAPEPAPAPTPRAPFKEPGPRQTPEERTAAQAEALDKAQEAIRFEKVDSLVQDALDNAKDVIKNGGNTADAVDDLEEALWQAKKFDRRGGGRGGDLVKELQKAIWAVQGADQEFRERDMDRRIGESRAKQRIRQEAKANA